MGNARLRPRGTMTSHPTTMTAVWRVMALAGVMAVGGCSSMNPVNWYRDVTGQSAHDPAPDADNQANLEAAGKAPYPNLATVPDTPTRGLTDAQRAQLREGLVADREHAHYTASQVDAGNAAAVMPPQAKIPEEQFDIITLPTAATPTPEQIAAARRQAAQAQGGPGAAGAGGAPMSGPISVGRTPDGRFIAIGPNGKPLPQGTVLHGAGGKTITIGKGGELPPGVVQEHPQPPRQASPMVPPPLPSAQLPQVAKHNAPPVTPVQKSGLAVGGLLATSGADTSTPAPAPTAAPAPAAPAPNGAPHLSAGGALAPSGPIAASQDSAPTTPQPRAEPTPEAPNPPPTPPKLAPLPPPSPVQPQVAVPDTQNPAVPQPSSIGGVAVPAAPPVRQVPVPSAVPAIPATPPTPAAPSSTAAGQHANSVSVGSIGFAAGSQSLPAGGDSTVKSAAAAYAAQHGGKLRIVGHAPIGNGGSDPAGQQLAAYQAALARVTKVKEALIAAGVPAASIVSEASPSSSGSDRTELFLEH